MNNKKQIYMLMKEASYEYKTGADIHTVLEILEKALELSLNDIKSENSTFEDRLMFYKINIDKAAYLMSENTDIALSLFKDLKEIVEVEKEKHADNFTLLAQSGLLNYLYGMCFDEENEKELVRACIAFIDSMVDFIKCTRIKPLISNLNDVLDSQRGVVIACRQLEIDNDIISSLCVGEDPVFDYDGKIENLTRFKTSLQQNYGIKDKGQPLITLDAKSSETIDN